MMNEKFEDYQYDSCISRGICSVNPRTSSLQEVLILYLKIAAHYALKQYENNIQNKDLKSLILNTISIMVSNSDFSESDFESITAIFNKMLPEIIDEDNSLEHLKSVLKSNKKVDIIKSIQLGEKEFLKRVKDISQEIRDLYKILFVIAKSICINVLDLESFDIDEQEGYLTILKLLNSLNYSKQEELLKEIRAAAEVDNRLMKLVRETQEKRYGKHGIEDVSYTTTPAKAILVVGSNIRELEDVLEAVKDKQIDVYTHDDMMLAHTFPKFKEYDNLKGQYGQGIENCLLDFATFPGPIVLTRHSLYNVENLYRGRLYTTDFAYSKGVVQIKNKDFSAVIEAAEQATGFKTGKQCETVTIGYDFEAAMQEIDQKVKNRSRIFLIGLNGYTIEQWTYFDKLFKLVPNDVLVVSLSYCAPKENIICLNACFDSYAVTEFAEALRKNYDLPLTVFFPKCDRHTMSQMIYLSTQENIGVFVGKCTPMILNPNLINTLTPLFGIKGLTSAKKDLNEII